MSDWFVLDTRIMWRRRWFDRLAAWWRSKPSVRELRWICCRLPRLFRNGLLLLCIRCSHD